jgi:predicted transcriptional regulator of viral defense system
MDPSGDDRLFAFAADHYAVFRGAHARTAGLSKKQIAGRIAHGRWRRLYDDVYIAAGAPLTWKGALLAACWAGGFRAAASHRSAAALWELAGGRRSIVEITCPRWRRAQHQGLVVHETKALDGIDTIVVEGIPVTTPERTLLDLGAVCHESVVEMALDAAEHRGLVTRASANETVRRLAKQGRNGAGTLRRLLATHDRERLAPESEMETALIQCLRRNGWPEPVPQYEIRQSGVLVARVDAAYPQWRIAVEYQSNEHHSGRLASKRDNDRRLRIIAAGWFPVEAMLPDVRNGGARLGAAIRAARERLPQPFWRQQGANKASS